VKILGSWETQMVGNFEDMGCALHKKFGKRELQMSNEFFVNLPKYRCWDYWGFFIRIDGILHDGGKLG
jgi:hypothetical protein